MIEEGSSSDVDEFKEVVSRADKLKAKRIADNKKRLDTLEEENVSKDS